MSAVRKPPPSSMIPMHCPVAFAPTGNPYSCAYLHRRVRDVGRMRLRHPIPESRLRSRLWAIVQPQDRLHMAHQLLRDADRAFAHAVVHALDRMLAQLHAERLLHGRRRARQVHGAPPIPGQFRAQPELRRKRLHQLHRGRVRPMPLAELGAAHPPAGLAQGLRVDGLLAPDHHRHHHRTSRWRRGLGLARMSLGLRLRRGDGLLFAARKCDAGLGGKSCLSFRCHGENLWIGMWGPRASSHDLHAYRRMDQALCQDTIASPARASNGCDKQRNCLHA